MSAERPVFSHAAPVVDCENQLTALFAEMNRRPVFPHTLAVQELQYLADYKTAKRVYTPRPEDIERGLIIDLFPPSHVDFSRYESKTPLELGEAYFRWAARDIGIFRKRKAYIATGKTERSRIKQVGLSYELSAQFGEWPLMLLNIIRQGGRLDLGSLHLAGKRRSSRLRIDKEQFSFSRTVTYKSQGQNKKETETIELAYLADKQWMERHRSYLGLMFADSRHDVWMYAYVWDEGREKPALIKVWSKKGFPEGLVRTWLAGVKDRYGDYPLVGMQDLSTIERIRGRELVLPGQGNLWVLDQTVNRLAPGEIIRFGPPDKPAIQDKLVVERVAAGGGIRVGVCDEDSSHILPNSQDYPLPPELENVYLDADDPRWQQSLYVYHNPEMQFDRSAAGQLMFMEMWYGDHYAGYNLFMAVPIKEGIDIVCRPILIRSSARLHSQLFGSVSSSTYEYLLSCLKEAK